MTTHHTHPTDHVITQVFRVSWDKRYGLFMKLSTDIKQETRERWETICQEWEARELQSLPAVDAARRLGISATTLTMALKCLRPGQYNPNAHKRRKARNFVYEPCHKCGKDSTMLFRFSVIDKMENVKFGTRQLFLCQECLGKITDILESREK